MDSGQIIFVYSRLILGALAAFLAIMLWAKTRDIAWMLLVIGTIIAYIEIVYSVLETLGISAAYGLMIGSVPLVAILLSVMRMLFFISAFLVMVVRHYRRKV
jgi:hypothetical protein